MRTTGGWLALAMLASGCNLSVVEADDPLYEATIGSEAPEAEAPEAPEAEPADREVAVAGAADADAVQAEADQADAAKPADTPASKAFYLALPLSGPHFRHANIYGKGELLPAGTRIVIDRIERGQVTGTIPNQWYDWYPETVAFIRRVYRIYFSTDEGACEDGCMAHWRAEDDAGFERRFNEVFVEQDPLADLDEKTRALVESHKVAGWFDAEMVRLSIGAPNAVVESGTARRWVYEKRYCRDLLLIAEPRLALEFTGEEVDNFQWLSATDFYYPLEPVDPQAGLCTLGGVRENPWIASGLPLSHDGFVTTALESQMAPDRPPHRVRDLVEQIEDGQLPPWRLPPSEFRSEPWGGILAQ